jgi:hypothetical protein
MSEVDRADARQRIRQDVAAHCVGAADRGLLDLTRLLPSNQVR